MWVIVLPFGSHLVSFWYVLPGKNLASLILTINVISTVEKLALFRRQKVSLFAAFLTTVGEKDRNVDFSELRRGRTFSPWRQIYSIAAFKF
jgi:hypothetical protein